MVKRLEGAEEAAVPGEAHLWEGHHCLLQVPITLLASKDVASQCSSPPVFRKGEQEEQGEEGSLRKWTLGICRKLQSPSKVP